MCRVSVSTSGYFSIAQLSKTSANVCCRSGEKSNTCASSTGLPSDAVGRTPGSPRPASAANHRTARAPQNAGQRRAFVFQLDIGVETNFLA
jgi:hypothetical protein